MDRLDGKVATITGATSGMGRDTAYVFAEEGAEVVVIGGNEAGTKEVMEAIKKSGGEASYVITDLSDRQSLDQIMDETPEKHETVDILFNNAGLLSVRDSIDIPIKEWDKIMQVNLTVALLLSKKVAPITKTKGQGYIVDIKSIAGASARQDTAAYCTSKHAANGLTKALIRELGPEIRVSAILPRAVSAAILDSTSGEAVVGGVKEISPLRRIG